MKALRTVIWSLLLVSSISSGNLWAQDVDYARYVVKSLASPEMKGRGYVEKGDERAARFIAGQFKKFGLKPVLKNYFQEYSLSINTFPGVMRVIADGRELMPARDYLVALSSPGRQQAYGLRWLINDSLPDSELFKGLQQEDLSQILVVTDKFHKELADSNLLKAGGYIFMKDCTHRLFWKASDGLKLHDFVVLQMCEGTITPQTQYIFLDFENHFNEKYASRNVLGIIPGRVQPDTLIVLTAHYDHLGMMGKQTLFPGANDNASGVAALLDFARHYSIPGNEPYYSMVFIALSGEEAGLLGSRFCAANPPFELGKVKFLINFDMVGTGSEGIGLVNGEILTRYAERIEKINEEKKYVKQIHRRGESCNSDHCPFYQKGVPAFFIYTAGKEWPYYHQPEDNAQGPPFTGYVGFFDLVRDFIHSLSPTSRIP
ncbi:MAG: M28 family metallopeptidase [Bacteroidales bacterium]